MAGESSTETEDAGHYPLLPLLPSLFHSFPASFLPSFLMFFVLIPTILFDPYQFCFDAYAHFKQPPNIGLAEPSVSKNLMFCSPLKL